MTEYAKPLPDVTQSLTAPFWAAAREGRLVVQRCARCGYLRWVPGPLCNECQQSGGDWTELPPQGRLVTFAEYHRAFDKSFASDVPYAVGLIQLTAGPRMYGKLTALVETGDIGRPVHAVFEAVTPDVTLVRWELDA
jgi:uncharacterized OB-fold protein